MTLPQEDPLFAQTGLIQNERKLRSSAAVHSMWGKCEDRTARTANARQAAFKKFEDLADPDLVLLPAERAKRAENLQKAHMQNPDLTTPQKFSTFLGPGRGMTFRVSSKSLEPCRGKGQVADSCAKHVFPQHL